MSTDVTILNTEIVELGNPLVEKFDNIFKEKYPNNMPGASVLIYKDDNVILKKGYGLADVEHDLAIKPNMTFHLGYLTKQFTALATLMLERDG